MAALMAGAWAASAQEPVAPIISLDQAIQEAIANNLDLAAQRLSVPIAEAREITARLRPNPVLTMAGMTLNLLGANYSSDSPLGPNQANFHVDIPLERGGKRQERIAVAKEEKSLAELGVREVMRQVIASVQGAFVDTQQAKENLKLALENLRSLQNVVAINEARLRAGDLAQVELDRSRLAALQYRTAVQQAELQLDQAKIQLQLAMGRKQRTTAFDVTSDMRRDRVLDSQEEIAKQAIARRPDFLTGQRAQARTRADLRLQLANGKVDYVVGTELSRQWAFGLTGNSLGFSLSIPLPLSNRNQGEIARAQREITQAQARLTAMEVSIQTEVDKAFRQYTVSQKLLTEVETEMLAKARSVRDTMEYSYRRGEASLVEYLDAQRAFNDAMQTFNEARANYARSLYLIDTVSGATVSGS